MVIVRSVIIAHAPTRQVGFELRQQLLDAVDDLMMLAPGWRWMLTITPGVCSSRRPAWVLDAVDRGAPRRRAGPARRCGRRRSRSVLVAGQQLIVGVDLVSPAAARRSCPWLVDAVCDERGAQVFEIDAVRRQRGRVGLDAHRGLLAAADADQADAGDLRDLLARAACRRGPRPARAAASRRSAPASGSARRRGWTCCRSAAWAGPWAGSVWAALIAACTSCSATSMFRSSANCSDDDRAAAGAGRGHLVEARHLPELPFQRRRHRRGHHVRAGAGIEGQHLDRRIVDLRQRRDRQLR